MDRSQRTKINTVDDRNWYSQPRLCTHVDDEFLAQLTQLYRERIPAGGKVLDMCSSWISHLPPEVEYSEVVGHGLNAEELGKNRRLSRFFVKNLNENPTFAAEDQTYDAVLCCVSVQYLQRPEEVFAEVYRVLKPGGVFIVSFSKSDVLREGHRGVARRHRIQPGAAGEAVLSVRQRVHQGGGHHGGWRGARRLRLRQAQEVHEAVELRSLLRGGGVQKLQARVDA